MYDTYISRLHCCGDSRPKGLELKQLIASLVLTARQRLPNHVDLFTSDLEFNILWGPNDEPGDINFILMDTVLKLGRLDDQDNEDDDDTLNGHGNYDFHITAEFKCNVGGTMSYFVTSFNGLYIREEVEEE